MRHERAASEETKGAENGTKAECGTKAVINRKVQRRANRRKDAINPLIPLVR